MIHHAVHVQKCIWILTFPLRVLGRGGAGGGAAAGFFLPSDKGFVGRGGAGGGPIPGPLLLFELLAGTTSDSKALLAGFAGVCVGTRVWVETSAASSSAVLCTA